MKLIDGKAIANGIIEELRKAITQMNGAGHTPGLAVVLVGDDPASRSYVRSKDRMCQSLGMHSAKHELPVGTTHDELVSLLRKLNADPQIHGILVQSPLPEPLDERRIFEQIDPRKDVDGFHPMNVAKLALGEADGFVPCTPLGCQRLLFESKIAISGAHVVVLGRSPIVGKPLALLLMQKGQGADATVTVAHSRTKNLAAVARSADILVAAIGRPEFVTADFVREGAVVLDVGINRVASSTPGQTRLVGDVAFDQVASKCAAITPVPGGVGPMTIAMLMANTVTACQRLSAKR